VLASAEPAATLLPRVQAVLAQEREVAALRRTPGLHHARDSRVLAGLFLGLALLAVLDMVVLRGRIGGLLQGATLLAAGAVVVFFGVRGYFVDAEVRIGYSVYQVMAVLFGVLMVTAMDLYLWFGARSLGRVRWGEVPARSQYVLVLLAVVFILTTGLMGYVRSGIRQAWHVYGVVRDETAGAYTPTTADAAAVITLASLLFMGLLVLLFRLGLRRAEGR